MRTGQHSLGAVAGPSRLKSSIFPVPLVCLQCRQTPGLAVLFMTAVAALPEMRHACR